MKPWSAFPLRYPCASQASLSCTTEETKYVFLTTLIALLRFYVFIVMSTLRVSVELWLRNVVSSYAVLEITWEVHKCVKYWMSQNKNKKKLQVLGRLQLQMRQLCRSIGMSLQILVFDRCPLNATRSYVPISAACWAGQMSSKMSSHTQKTPLLMG